MRRTALVLLVCIVGLVSWLGDVLAECYTDTPGCSCFVDGGAWDPAAQPLTEVARSTLGTQESCIAEGGKPYYQMCVGINNKDHCEIMSLLDSIGWVDLPDRGYWCSEAVSYWHREAAVPYEKGYARADDPNSWRKTNTMKLASWYRTEEASGGRGRWIDGSEIDYNNFVPGVNAPCPGSFIALDECTIAASGMVTWSDTNYHSLIIDDMTVYKDINHKIFKVQVDFIEGNSSHKVKVDTKFSGDDHILSYTVKGPNWIGSNRKIYGFGIDLDSRGRAIMSKPVKYVDYGDIAVVIPIFKIISESSNAWSKFYKPLEIAMTNYYKKVKKAGGLKFVTNISGTTFKNLPTLKAPWVFKPNSKSSSEVIIDLVDTYPESVNKFNLTFDTFIPLGFKVAYAGTDKKFTQAIIPDKVNTTLPRKPGMRLPLSFKLKSSGVGTKIRYIKIMFAKNLLKENAKLVDFSFDTEEGPAKDAEFDGQN